MRRERRRRGYSKCPECASPYGGSVFVKKGSTDCYFNNPITIAGVGTQLISDGARIRAGAGFPSNKPLIDVQGTSQPNLTYSIYFHALGGTKTTAHKSQSLCGMLSSREK